MLMGMGDGFMCVNMAMLTGKAILMDMVMMSIRMVMHMLMRNCFMIMSVLMDLGRRTIGSG